MADSYLDIRTIEDAKEMYWRFGCSHFHMEREAPESYIQYCALQISESQETVWTRELQRSRLAEFMQLDPLGSEFADGYASLAYLVSDDKELLISMLTASQIVLENGQPSDALVAVEKIVGDPSYQSQSGMAFTCFELGEIELSKQFVDLAILLANKARAPQHGLGLGSVQGVRRAEQALAHAKDVSRELFNR